MDAIPAYPSNGSAPSTETISYASAIGEPAYTILDSSPYAYNLTNPNISDQGSFIGGAEIRRRQNGRAFKSRKPWSDPIPHNTTQGKQHARPALTHRQGLLKKARRMCSSVTSSNLPLNAHPAGRIVPPGGIYSLPETPSVSAMLPSFERFYAILFYAYSPSPLEFCLANKSQSGNNAISKLVKKSLTSTPLSLPTSCGVPTNIPPSARTLPDTYHTRTDYYGVLKYGILDEASCTIKQALMPFLTDSPTESSFSFPQATRATPTLHLKAAHPSTDILKPPPPLLEMFLNVSKARSASAHSEAYARRSTLFTLHTSQVTDHAPHADHFKVGSTFLLIPADPTDPNTPPFFAAIHPSSPPLGAPPRRKSFKEFWERDNVVNVDDLESDTDESDAADIESVVSASSSSSSSASSGDEIDEIFASLTPPPSPPPPPRPTLLSPPPLPSNTHFPVNLLAFPPSCSPRSALPFDFAPGTTFRYIPLGSVVSHVRSFDAADRDMEVPFMDSLLGTKKSTHVRFDDSDDDDDDESDYGDEGDDDSSVASSHSSSLPPSPPALAPTSHLNASQVNHEASGAQSEAPVLVCAHGETKVGIVRSEPAVMRESRANRAF